MGMLVQNLVEVRGDDGTRIHHGIAERLRLVALARFVQTASRPNAGSLAAIPLSGPNTCPG